MYLPAACFSLPAWLSAFFCCTVSENSLSRFSCKTFLLKLAAAGRRNRNRNCARRGNKATATAAASGHATVDTLCQSSLLQQSLLVTVNVTSNVSFSVSVSCCSFSCSRSGYRFRFITSSFFCCCSFSYCLFCSLSLSLLLPPLPLCCCVLAAHIFRSTLFGFWLGLIN